MTSQTPTEADNNHQKSLIETPVGVPGSGKVRYAAAMYFYKQGKISAELLEIYRRCCKWDHEDPRELAKHEGIKLGELSQ